MLVCCLFHLHVVASADTQSVDGSFNAIDTTIKQAVVCAHASYYPLEMDYGRRGCCHLLGKQNQHFTMATAGDISQQSIPRRDDKSETASWFGSSMILTNLSISVKPLSQLALSCSILSCSIFKLSQLNS
jgi:hypothetical protein